METHHISAAAGSTRSSSQWTDLPHDLLDKVQLRLASKRDRLCLAAACKAWRAAVSRIPAPPPIPLLLLSPCAGQLHKAKHLCGPDDGWVVGVPEKVEGKFFVGSHDGGWVAAVDWPTLAIVNLFSGAEVAVSLARPPNQAFISPKRLSKIIFSGDPTSSSCILAAIYRQSSHVALCKVGGHENEWTVQDMRGKDKAREKAVVDIAFCNGELYCFLYPNEELVKFTIDTKLGSMPIITSSHTLAIKRRDKYHSSWGHLIELHGKPSMAIQTRWLPNRQPFFKVFTLVDIDDDEVYKYKWVETLNFGDHALFLGPKWSKAVHVTIDGHNGLEKNHIYYSIENREYYYMENIRKIDRLPNDAVYFTTMDDGEHMYCRKDQSVGDGIERIGYYVTGCSYFSMWIYPPLL